MTQHGQQSTVENGVDGRRPFLAKLLAIGDAEWHLVSADGPARRELQFHAAALLLCPAYLGFAVFHVAHTLFEYPLWIGIALAGAATTGLFLVDMHYLIQRRGTPEGQRGSVNKVRFATLMVLMVASSLFATHAFREDIDRELASQRADIRAALKNTPRYEARIAAAHNDIERAQDAQRQADELRSDIARLKVQRAEAWTGYHNEIEGNTTDGRVRVPGRGPKARGFERRAKRLGREIETRKLQLKQVKETAERAPQARQLLREIQTQIDRAVRDQADGALKRLKALWELTRKSPVSALAVIFWMAVGMILDIPIWVAQGRVFNHAVLARAREADEEAQLASIGRYRREMRTRQAESLAPIEVSLNSPEQVSVGGDGKSEAHSGFTMDSKSANE